jgi:O-acetyl-ADP-ribose deacetylase (regulator of RNase III)
MENNWRIPEKIFRPLQYSFQESTLQVEYRDLSRVEMDVLVSSADVDLSMTGGVSKALVQIGGELVREEACTWAPIEIGRVAITSAGKLKARRIFHAAVVDNRHRSLTTIDLIRLVVRRCLVLCNELGFQSIAFPALGTGAAGLSSERSTAVMLLEIVQHLSQFTNIHHVLLAIYPREDLPTGFLSQYYSNVEHFLFLFTRMESIIAALDGMKTNYYDQQDLLAAKITEDIRKKCINHQARWEVELIGFEPNELSLPSMVDFDMDLERISQLPRERGRNQFQAYGHASALREVIAIRQRNIIDLEKELAMRGFSVEINRQIDREKEKISQLEDTLKGLLSLEDRNGQV